MFNLVLVAFHALMGTFMASSIIPAYSDITQKLGVSMQQAVSKWWNAPVTDPAASHTYSPCHYKMTSPHKCNPTC